MFDRKTTLATTAIATALAIFAGPSNGASGLQISNCDQVVTANAVVTKDLTCSGTNGIIVDASGITIDLGGHSLTGDLTHNGVVNAGHLHVTVKNGVLHKFDRGVSAFAGADYMMLSNVVLVGNVDVGAYVNGNSVSIAASTAAGNGGDGVFVYGNSATVKSSTGSANGHNGIYVWGDSASITSVTATGNASEGVRVSGASSSVKSSSAAGNATFGFDLQGNATSVTSSTASGNGQSGIWIKGDSASVKGMKASGNGAHGIVVIGDAATLTGNRADANGFPGAVSDNYGLGIYVDTYLTAPVGKNVARANDGPADCQPASLCPAPAVKSAKAGWTPITACGQTVTTNGLLTKDLDCAAAGINVGAPGITIDLSGHVVKGGGFFAGIFDNGYDGVAIMNGAVRNFTVGVSAVNGADGLKISNIVASGNADEGLYIVGDAASISSSTLSGNGIGIGVTGDSATVKSSTAAGNAAYGIHVTGVGTSVKSSSSLGNALNGFYLQGNSTSVSTSTASGNAGHGLVVAGDSASVNSTKVLGNAGNGFWVSGSAAVLTGNSAQANGFPGGASDGVGLGMLVSSYSAAPTGSNVARGNDDATECTPSSLC